MKFDEARSIAQQFTAAGAAATIKLDPGFSDEVTVVAVVGMVKLEELGKVVDLGREFAKQGVATQVGGGRAGELELTFD
jgi:hypothetical protein